MGGVVGGVDTRLESRGVCAAVGAGMLLESRGVCVAVGAGMLLESRITGVARATNFGFTSATAKSRALAKRSLGRLAIAVRTAPSTCGGIDGKSDDGDGGCTEITCCATSSGVAPWNAGSPTSIS